MSNIFKYEIQSKKWKCYYSFNDGITAGNFYYSRIFISNMWLLPSSRSSAVHDTSRYANFFLIISSLIFTSWILKKREAPSDSVRHWSLHWELTILQPHMEAWLSVSNGSELCFSLAKASLWTQPSLMSPSHSGQH